MERSLNEDDERKRRLRNLGILLVPLAVIALIVRFLSPTPSEPPRPAVAPTKSAFNEDDVPRPIPEIKFPTYGPTPAGKVTMADIEFPPTRRLFPSPFYNSIDTSYAKGNLQLSNSRKEKPFWTGPIEKADFVEEVVDAVHTLKDGTGKVIWSNARERGTPDILIQRSPSGQGEIHGKDGALLWSGPLPSSSGGTRSESKGKDQIKIQIAGLTIEGFKGAFTITDGATTKLWSGPLPAKPSVLFRDGDRYSYSGKSGASSGASVTRNVHLEAEPIQIIVTNSQGKVLGQRPSDSLRIREQMRFAGQKTPSPMRPSYRQIGHSNDIQLKVKGTAFLTFKDKTGRVIKRAKLFREVNKDGNGFTRGYYES